MDDKLLVAIVAASAALLGGIIQKAFDLISNWQKTKHEHFKDLRNIQKEVYWGFISAMQKFINHQKYQTEIINAMRKHLEMDKLENFELISFTPQ